MAEGGYRVQICLKNELISRDGVFKSLKELAEKPVEENSWYRWECASTDLYELPNYKWCIVSAQVLAKAVSTETAQFIVDNYRQGRQVIVFETFAEQRLFKLQEELQDIGTTRVDAVKELYLKYGSPYPKRWPDPGCGGIRINESIELSRRAIRLLSSDQLKFLASQGVNTNDGDAAAKYVVHQACGHYVYLDQARSSKGRAAEDPQCADIKFTDPYGPFEILFGIKAFVLNSGDKSLSLVEKTKYHGYQREAEVGPAGQPQPQPRTSRGPPRRGYPSVPLPRRDPPAEG